MSKTETYYRVEYRIGNAWQPLREIFWNLNAANQKLGELIESNRNHPEGPLTDGVRLLKMTQLTSVEEYKSIDLN